MAKEPKRLVDYVEARPEWWDSELAEYARRPGSAFLREAVHISDAMNQCRRKFHRKKSGRLNKDGQDSVYRLGAAAFSSLMSHFETYEKTLFAGIVEASRFVQGFKLEECCKRLRDDSRVEIDLGRLFAYRGRGASVGQLVADSLGSWHSPNNVNRHFKAVVPDFQLFSGDDIVLLSQLWQLRHSIVHTGGWMTHADSQKVRELAAVADRPILLDELFVETVARRLHPVVSRCTVALGQKFLAALLATTPPADRAVIQQLFVVESPRNKWLGAG